MTITRIVQSATRPTVQHVVVLGPQVLCTCEGWRNRGKCHHMRDTLPTVAACPVCEGTVSHQPGVVACNRCEWAAVN